MGGVLRDMWGVRVEDVMWCGWSVERRGCGV